MKYPIDKMYRIGIAVALVVTAGNTVLAVQSTRSLYQSASEVTHTYVVFDALGELLSSAKDAETGERGFVITGDPQYLQPYHMALGILPERLRSLDTLTRDNPREHARFPELRRAIGEKLEDMRQSIALRQDEGFAAAERLVTSGRGKATMDGLRAQVQEMVNDEDARLVDRRVRALRHRDFALTGLVLAGLLELLTLAALLYLVRRKVRVREAAAAALNQQKEWFRTTLASIGDGVITTDIDGRVAFLNPVAEALTGWRVDDAAGHPLDVVFDIINQDTRERVPNPAMRALRDGVIVGLANHSLLVARDGTERPIDDCAAPIRGAGDAIVGSVLVFRDISDRRLAEQQVREADRRKDEFLAVLAHELRNPLAPLHNALSVVRLSQNDPAAIERVGGIMERQLRQMVRLIDDLLDVSRITSNRLELRRESSDLSAVVHLALETVGPLLRESGHSLKLVLPPSPLHVDADPTRMAQAFANLLGNAIKYTAPGGRVWLTVERDGNEAVVTVRDTGIGIPADKIDTIFEMFTQVDRSLEGARTGLGIGLSLTRRIVEMHGGAVSASSPGPGAGSEFVVRLPLVLAPSGMARDPAVTAAARRQRRRVLVADDNADAADSLAMMLRMMGHQLAVAYDGSEALSEGERFRPEIALLDIGMPKLNGYDVARAIRASEWGQQIVLVALTGWGQDEDRRRSQDAGFDHHMVKPVDLSALESVLNATG
ncbi:MAG TPA: CHASE3 domain-containing protein [Gemmatimonadales bacterium]|jgi:PAS domain S-box-containing protein